jgi:hypothetical protein
MYILILMTVAATLNSSHIVVLPLYFRRAMLSMAGLATILSRFVNRILTLTSKTC